MKKAAILLTILTALTLATGCAGKIIRTDTTGTTETETVRHRQIETTIYTDTGAVASRTVETETVTEGTETKTVTQNEVKPNDNRISRNIALFCGFILALFGVIALIIWRLKR